MSEGKIIITGPGRSGTTFLVQLLTRLGFETGYYPGKEGYDANIRAGCEFTVNVDLQCDPAERIREAMDEAPRVLKSPEWGLILKGLLTLDLLRVDHVLCPVRDLDLAAKSRIDAGLDWLVDPTLQGEDRRRDQAMVHAMALGRVVEACLLYDVPLTIMKFPALVVDEEYLYQKVKGLGPFTRSQFGDVFGQLARPTQIKWSNNGPT